MPIINSLNFSSIPEKTETEEFSTENNTSGFSYGDRFINASSSFSTSYLNEDYSQQTLLSTPQNDIRFPITHSVLANSSYTYIPTNEAIHANSSKQRTEQAALSVNGSNSGKTLNIFSERAAKLVRSMKRRMAFKQPVDSDPRLISPLNKRFILAALALGASLNGFCSTVYVNKEDFIRTIT
ncbi:hypothetical protein BDF20DRAFT_878444 [Mycotypha africana]|uniref:uncharacterized protein n=1 Tax=Mycotypha africana TaxID=64632 RepID=UPI002300CF2D|nr:uncharacterized protein BDF20DRAFT_878444 [Mycotypha africana]KAI8975402.1 hypothetical protein BDF20DRAFT_878444 [Mycotypha africana]